MSETALANELPLHSNRLAQEKSPYLLQHAHNPVDWYPWSEEAFRKAAAENKPVFLSIGYSTCHWCHVMERESFENPATAAILNRDFVAIKVDREERPDIDGVYMQYVIATTGSGGWPMSVFLTPDKKPFYGGTYFPPQDRYGMPGFPTLLSSIAEAWKTRRHEILHSADSAVKFLSDEKTSAPEKNALGPAALDHAFSHFEGSFDAERGGFGGAPKFPRSHAISFLLRYWKRTGSGKALVMSRRTLDAMKDGGIYDQLGGGFHRYSTDNLWRIPHFEKMLYDQALLVNTYVEAYQATGDPEYARVVRETLDYVLRDMTDCDGGFYSAEDADSADAAHPGEKKEGAFFLWTEQEIRNLLGEKGAAVFIYYYGIAASGNAVSDPHHEFEGKNVLYRAHTAEETASFLKTTPAEVEKSLEKSRGLLFSSREKRPRPFRDDKILTDWNGLMITGFAAASRALGEPRYAEAAAKAADFVSSKLSDGRGNLLHRYRGGEAAIPGNLDDYVFMMEAYLELYEATFDLKWLDRARGTAEKMTALFRDDKRKGFFLTSHDAEALITRPKEVYDGAVPSGNSVAALALLKLGRMTGEERWERESADTLDAFGASVAASPANFTAMLEALDFAIGPSSEVVIAADEGNPQAVLFLKEIRGHFSPNQVVLWNRGGAGPEFLKDKAKIAGQPAVYICRGYVCQAPVTDLRKLKEALGG